MSGRNSVIWLAVIALALTGNATAWAADVVIKVVMVADEDENPTAAGKAAGKALLEAMGDTALKAVVMSECFEDREYKAELLKGVCEVLPKEKVLGGATYGSFTQEGCTDFDAVCLMGIGGRGVRVSARMTDKMGTSKLTFEEDEDLIRERLHAAGEALAAKLKRRDNDKLLILIADAHSPKVQYLVEGVQKEVGKDFPITGGCANKNAGQTFVYFQGEMYEDAAVALMLAGNFDVALSGRMANEEQAVIKSAADGVAEMLEKGKGDPAAVLAFNCAGRRSKLNEYEDELASMQKVLGKDVTLFGCYCAGEIGPVDEPDALEDVLSGGSGWHVMFTSITPGKARTPKEKRNNSERVSGTITVDGRPIEGAVITLISQKGQPAAQGTTDGAGNYTLKTVKGDSRIPAGAFGVTISKTVKDNDSGVAKELLPLKYAMKGVSGLTVEVVAPGVNVFDFELASE
jgi:hypothetical protein